ncbi:hypothetical protein ACS0TY_016189 [Phlomoides rotata]
MLLSLLSKRTLYDDSRDAYGFTVRPQHIHRFREYANIYKEEEGERLQKWKSFLEQQVERTREDSCKEDNIKPLVSDDTQQSSDPAETVSGERDDSSEQLARDDSTTQSNDPAETVSGERDNSTEQLARDDPTEQSSNPAETVCGERDDSTEQLARDDSTAQSGDPAETVSGERDNSTEPLARDDPTKQSRNPAETVSGERDDSTEQLARDSEVTAENTEPDEDVSGEGDGSRKKRYFSGTEASVSVPTKESPQSKSLGVKTWAGISPSLNFIEHMMSVRVKKRKNMKNGNIRCMYNDLPPIDEAGSSGDESADDDKDASHDHERIDSANASAVESSASDITFPETFSPWKEELESLVRIGIPKDLRGEVWQAFVGVRTRRVESYYQDLLATECDASDGKEHDQLSSGDSRKQHEREKCNVPDKCKKQIEKDLPRTFPGHPALNENGRNSLRRVLLAYAQHNPSVGYCQAMNFFAGLLLLMMPEENAFWTLVGIMDDYFDGYFSQEMTESQIDQLVFEDLMRERFPKLVNHLDYLGVEVAWISGPWFLSIFVNTLPWESVLRVWDVILFEGNRVMLFRTALALMDLYGPAIVTTKDAGDAITLLQTLTGSTFDSSQLVLTACMGFLTITEDRLQELREKHRPAIVAAIEGRAKGGPVSKDPKSLATKLYSFKHDRGSIVKENKSEAGSDDKIDLGEPNIDPHSGSLDEFLNGITIDSEVDSVPDLQEQVVWLKVELCRMLEEKRSAELRAEELEAAFMEMVKEDNRRELSARVEQLEKEVAELREALADKKEGENAMLQVLLKVEQEQRVTEDARLFAEQQVAAQKHAVHVLQEKYDEMEKRAVMAESMLEATLQYESGQSKALSSPLPGRPDSPAKRIGGLLSFGRWRDRNKATAESKVKEGCDASKAAADTNGH